MPNSPAPFPDRRSSADRSFPCDTACPCAASGPVCGIQRQDVREGLIRAPQLGDAGRLPALAATPLEAA